MFNTTSTLQSAQDHMLKNIDASVASAQIATPQQAPSSRRCSLLIPRLMLLDMVSKPGVPNLLRKNYISFGVE